VPGRRFPPPWTVEEYNDACFIVRDGRRLEQSEDFVKSTTSVTLVTETIAVTKYSMQLLG
jgi:hypothetical protein